MVWGLNKGLGWALIVLTQSPENLAIHQGGEMLLFCFLNFLKVSFTSFQILMQKKILFLFLP